MDKFCIITNKIKDSDEVVTNQIRDLIEKAGKKVVEADEADCAIVLGGDGTLIRAARELHSYEIPLIGVNLGTVGYLAEIELQHLEEGINKLLFSDPIVEERMVIRGEVESGTWRMALNDIVFSRKGDLRVIHFNIYVNGELLHSYQADGVIVSTPTGSTGYSMSAGGPIVEPTACMFVITPICSHSLNNRSIVLSADDCIEIELSKNKMNPEVKAIVSFDGCNSIEMSPGDKVKILKGEFTTKIMKLSSVSFLEILRRKMKGC